MHNKDIHNLTRHVEDHGVNELKSDTARLESLITIMQDCVEEIGDITQRYSWLEGLEESKKNLWIATYGLLLDIEKAHSNYDSAVKIAEASLLMRKFHNLQQS